jgi:methylase of polypeptide subunit release factors
LISALHRLGPSPSRRAGLDMGVGSGIVLAVLAALRLTRLVGVDIDPDALRATRELARAQRLAPEPELLLGSLWTPLGQERFDLIASNLPQFAAEHPADPEHTPYWSSAGRDGRLFLDPFLLGLPDHLTPGGMALITHNVFLGRDRTETILSALGLTSRVVASTSVLLHPRKASLLDPALRDQGSVVGIHRVGPYDFIDVDILEIRARPG